MSVSEAQEAKHLRVENRQQKKLVVVEMKEDYASLLYAEECLRIAMQADDSDEEGTSCLKNPHPLPSSDSGTHSADEKLDEIED